MSHILSLDSTGQPRDWLTWKKACFYEAKKLVSWKTGEITFTFNGGHSRLTGERSQIVTASIIAIKGDPSAGKRRKQVPTLNNPDLFRRDWHVCAYCGDEHKNSHLTRDHITPKSQGGRDVWMNVVTCCKDCNQTKDNKTPEQAGMQLLYVPYVPNHAEALILANREILYDQMEFLLSFVPRASRVHAYKDKIKVHEPHFDLNIEEDAAP